MHCFFKCVLYLPKISDGFCLLLSKVSLLLIPKFPPFTERTATNFSGADEQFLPTGLSLIIIGFQLVSKRACRIFSISPLF